MKAKKRSGTMRWGLIAALAAGALIAPPAWAGDCYWSNTADGVYGDTANWAGGSVPGEGDGAFFTNNNTYTVSFNSSATVLSNVFDSTRSGNVTLAIGAGRTWTAVSNAVISLSANRTNAVTLASGTWMVTNNLNLAAGSGSQGSLTVAGTDASLVVSNSLQVGVKDSSGDAVLTVSNGAVVCKNLLANGTSKGGTILLTGPNALLVVTNGEVRIGGDQGDKGFVIVSNGTMRTYGVTANFGYGGVGALTMAGGRFEGGNVTIGLTATAAGSKVLLVDSQAVFRCGTLTVGSSGGPCEFTVSNGTATVSGVNIGKSSAVNVYGGNLIMAPNSTLTMTATGTTNSVYIGNGGLMEVNKVTIGEGTDTTQVNTITNFGGILQFSTNAPAITFKPQAGTVRIAITNGTIAFRAVTNVDVKGNWSGTGLTNFTWLGANTFRLNNASNTAAATQDYVFDTGLGATNYARLEMVNGGTAYRGGSLTIGTTGGSVLFSNTTAAIAGAFTNRGVMTVVDSTVTMGSCALEGGSIVWATNAAPSNLVSVAGALTASGAITLNASNAVVGTSSSLVLFHADGGIAGGATWNVMPAPYSVVKRGNDLVLAVVQRGTVILIR